MTRLNPKGVYVAHPKSTYATAWEAQCLDAIRMELPDARLVNPAVEFSTANEWRRGYKRCICRCDLVVVFGDEAGIIGFGTITEIAFAAAQRIPLVFLDPTTGQLCERAWISEPPWRRSLPRTPAGIVTFFRRFARVRVLPPSATPIIEGSSDGG